MYIIGSKIQDLRFRAQGTLGFHSQYVEMKFPIDAKMSGSEPS